MRLPDRWVATVLRRPGRKWWRWSALRQPVTSAGVAMGIKKNLERARELALAAVKRLADELAQHAANGMEF